MHPDEIPFLNAILHEPNEDAPRLVYADWLEERGDPRAFFLRLDVEFAHERDAGLSEGDVPLGLAEIARGIDADWINLVSHARTTPAGVVQELTCLLEGYGQIEVLGGDIETVLLVDGKPIAFNWDDCLGSVGQYLVQTGTCGEAYLDPICDLASGKFEENRFVHQIAPLLSAFTPGIYRIVYTPSTAMAVEPGGWAIVVSSSELQNYYPVGRSLIRTQSPYTDNRDRVGTFRHQITNGVRPIVITASVAGAWCEFVIDGHHKLEAYYIEHVPPAVLSIERSEASPISLPVGVSYFPPNHPGIDEYRRMKRGGT